MLVCRYANILPLSLCSSTDDDTGGEGNTEAGLPRVRQECEVNERRGQEARSFSSRRIKIKKKDRKTSGIQHPMFEPPTRGMYRTLVGCHDKLSAKCDAGFRAARSTPGQDE